MNTFLLIWLVGALATFIMVSCRAYVNRDKIKNKLQEMRASAEKDLENPDDLGFPVAAALALIMTFLFAAAVIIWPLYLYKVITKKGKE